MESVDEGDVRDIGEFCTICPHCSNITEVTADEVLRRFVQCEHCGGDFEII